MSDSPEPRKEKRSDPKSVNIFELGVWVGLVSGGVDAAYAFVRSVVLESWMPFGEMIFWSGPASQAVLLGLTALPLAMLARKFPGIRRFAYGVLIFLGCLYVCLLLPIHLLAGGILSLGVAVQLSRLIVGFPRASAAVVRWTMVAMLLIIAGTYYYMAIYPSVREGQQVAQRAPAPEGLPNVLLVVLDTVSEEYLQAAQLPKFQAAMAKGVRFSNAYATSPWTLPSHLSMFTGLWRHEVEGNLFLSKWKADSTTLAEWLRDHGYRTGGFVGNTYYCSASTGIDRGFDHYEDFYATAGTLAKHNKFFHRFNNSSVSVRMGLFDRFGRKSAAEVNDGFLKWIDGHEQGRPFFAFLNYFDAHDPYVPPKEYRNSELTSFENRMLMRFWWTKRKEKLTEGDVEVAKRAYIDCMRYMDDEWDKLVQQLESRGVLDNTIVIITADHGEHFGEKGVFGHANSLYEQLVHVPFSISWGDKIPQGQTCDRLVSMRDIAATIVEMTGITDKSPLPGRSMTPLWEGNPEEFADDPVFTAVMNHAPAKPNHGYSPAETSPLHSIVSDGWKLIVDSEGKEELFNLVEDPGEDSNLAEDSGVQEKLAELRAMLPSASP